MHFFKGSKTTVDKDDLSAAYHGERYTKKAFQHLIMGKSKTTNQQLIMDKDYKETDH